LRVFNWEHEKEREQIETLAFPKVKVKLIGMNHPNSSFNKEYFVLSYLTAKCCVSRSKFIRIMELWREEKKQIDECEMT
jgi:hypothetical protein